MTKLGERKHSKGPPHTRPTLAAAALHMLIRLT